MTGIFPNSIFRHLYAPVIAGFAFLMTFVTCFGQKNIEVEGMGIIDNRKLESRLTFLHGIKPDDTVLLDSIILEDTAFLLIEQVKRDGYLNPVLKGMFEVGETEQTFEWGAEYDIQLPVEFEADKAVFRIEPGVQYYYESVSIKGIEFMPADKLERFFIPGGFLFELKSSKVFTHGNLERRTQRLLDTLESKGYRSAKVVEQKIDKDDETGATRVFLTLVPGPQHVVGSVEVKIVSDDSDTETKNLPHDAGTHYTSEWERGVWQEILNDAYRAGYPDAKVKLLSDTVHEEGNNTRRHELVYQVSRGGLATVGEIRFEGNPGTQNEVLSRRIALSPGAPLNRLEMESGRRKLMGLGIYDRVGVEMLSADERNRDVVYNLEPGVRKEMNLLVGWGSYEQARGGAEWIHRNPFGRAHRYNVKVKQSIKSTEVSAKYTVPQVLATAASVYLRNDYSAREEVSYDRTVFGSAIGTTFRFENGLRVGVEYSISQQETERSANTDFLSENDAMVAGVEINSSWDQRDSALNPTSGYLLYGKYRISEEYFGGQVGFHQVNLGTSAHYGLTESTVAHVGFSGSLIISSAKSSENIPFTERIFTGGSDSVRGYREGRASPLDSQGQEIGAESQVLANIELEQRLSQHISVVMFVDAVANAREGVFSDGVEQLNSVGSGLRYRTPLGPMRLEYGHNLNPRVEDPEGQLHFSIGFPF